MSDRLPLMLTLAGVVLVLLLLAAMKFAVAPTTARVGGGDVVSENTVAMADFAIAPLETLAQTRDRPLFFLNRRYPPKTPPSDVQDEDVPSTDEPLETPSEFKLSAVIIENREPTALLANAADGAVHRVKPGQAVGGWTLKSVEVDRVTLVRGTNAQELRLRTFESPAAPPAPASTKAPSGASRTERTREALRQRVQARAERRERAAEQRAKRETAEQQQPPRSGRNSAAAQGKNCGLSRC